MNLETAGRWNVLSTTVFFCVQCVPWRWCIVHQNMSGLLGSLLHILFKFGNLVNLVVTCFVVTVFLLNLSKWKSQALRYLGIRHCFYIETPRTAMKLTHREAPTELQVTVWMLKWNVLVPKQTSFLSELACVWLKYCHFKISQMNLKDQTKIGLLDWEQLWKLYKSFIKQCLL
jgi:hypothetical protein